MNEQKQGRAVNPERLIAKLQDTVGQQVPMILAYEVLLEEADEKIAKLSQENAELRERLEKS